MGQSVPLGEERILKPGASCRPGPPDSGSMRSLAASCLKSMVGSSRVAVVTVAVITLAEPAVSGCSLPARCECAATIVAVIDLSGRL